MILNTYFFPLELLRFDEVAYLVAFLQILFINVSYYHS